MDNYTLDYKGNIVSLLRTLNPNNFQEFLALELDLLETLRYEEIIEKNNSQSKNNQDDQLINIILKVANANTCKFAFSQIVELGYQTRLPNMYCSLFEREPELIQEVLVYLIKTYSKDELTPEVESTNTHSYLDRNKTHKEFTFYVGYNDEENMWINRHPQVILDNFKLLNDHLSSSPKVLEIQSLVKKYEQQGDDEQIQDFFKAITHFIIENDYELDYKLAPEFLCLSYNLENVETLFNHLSKSADFQHDLLVYLAKQFHQSEDVSSELQHILYYSRDDSGVSFLEDKNFIRLILTHDLFPEDVKDMSLESLVKAHFDFILNDKKAFNDELISFLKPNESVKNYITCLDYEDKKTLLASLSKHEKFQPLINNMYANVLESYLFDKHLKNVNIPYLIEYRYKTEEEKKEKIKDLQNEQKYLEIFLNEEHKLSKKIKI
jgi:hypothetical protein